MHRDDTILAVGMAEAARRLGLSSRTVATLVVRRQLPSRKVGRRRIIPVSALEAFVKRAPTTSERDQSSICHSRGVLEGK